ncbi:hypothetical protein OG921_18800 [Aldersonia sp. NBC_00410]|uniref:hypothetical protein n=1 Tax=Aldersonia sp. NBC_00410 TaxID=2975954 RepID=UPI002254AA22|nr:hypothetical protein [Aldersonia sp. NBC_00410]MCX5045219.1 hypothetical protein [Aldersonia sp. NBC_00410]
MTKPSKLLTEAEYVLIRETKRRKLTGLDEDDLIDLHTRVRRARNKYVKLYRRKGAAKVDAKKARGQAKSANRRNAEKAEVFEEALSRVSLRLATLAAHSALELKEERLAAAHKEGTSFASTRGDGKVTSAGRARADTTRDSAGRKKYEASRIAAGARRQAKKDGRGA